MQENVSYSKFRWFWLWTITFSYMVVGMSIVCPATMVGDMAHQMGVSVAQVSFASMAVFSLANAVGTILGGPLLDKFGVSKSITIGALLTLIPYLLIPSLGGTTGGLMTLRIITGLATGPVVGCVSIIALRWFPKNERAIYSGFQGSGIALGIFLSFIIVPRVFELTGKDWQITLAWLGLAPLLALISCFITLFVKPTTPEPKHADHSVDFKAAVRSPFFYLTIAVIFFSLWAMDAFNDLTPGYMAIPVPMGLGFGGKMAGLSMTFVSVGAIIGSLLSGFLVRFLFKNNVKPIILISFVGCAIFSISVAFPFVYSSMGLLLTCLFLQGFTQSFAIPQMALYVAQNFPVTVAGRVYGTAMGIGVFGSVGISVGAFLLHATGHYIASIFAVGIVCVIGLVIATFLKGSKEIETAVKA